MPTRLDSKPKERQKYIVAFGNAIKRWREMNGWSQQVPHELCRVLKINFHNSQLAYLERGVLDPKADFFIALAELNSVIAKNKFPPTQEGFTQSTRDRLKDSESFITSEGELANATDFFAMFIGLQPLHKKYTAKYQLTDDFCNKYGHSLEKAFNKISYELMLSPKKTWDALAKTKGFPKEKAYLSLCRQILIGQHELTKAEALHCLKMVDGKTCPCYRGLSLLANTDESPVDITTLTRENQKLVELATA